MYVDPLLYAAEELANAVIIQAAIDYRQAIKLMKALLDTFNERIIENLLFNRYI